MLSQLKYALNNSYNHYEDLRDNIKFFTMIINEEISKNDKGVIRTKQRLRSILRNIDPKYDERIINYFYISNDDMGESFAHCLLIDANSKDEVYKILFDIGFEKEGSPYIDYGFDCTGQIFGGEPNIKKIYKGRYFACMAYQMDV